MACCESRTSFAASRRALLLGGASFAAWAYLPKFARAADGRDPRLVVIILRGALDGLATVAPVGDPDYAGLHGSIALTSDGPHAALRAGLPRVQRPGVPPAVGHGEAILGEGEALKRLRGGRPRRRPFRCRLRWVAGHGASSVLPFLAPR